MAHDRRTISGNYEVYVTDLEAQGVIGSGGLASYLGQCLIHHEKASCLAVLDTHATDKVELHSREVAARGGRSGITSEILCSIQFMFLNVSSLKSSLHNKYYSNKH